MKFHLVLVSKHANKVFTNEILTELEKIVINVSKKWFVNILEFNGEEDHIHILLELNPTIQTSKYICNLKTVTSRIIRKKYHTHINKYYLGTNALWSRAYCLISTGDENIDEIKKTYVVKNRDFISKYKDVKVSLTLLF